MITGNRQLMVPPGFRFHPTDEELLYYYLRKKLAYEAIDLDVIRDVDLNKLEPWDLKGRSFSLSFVYQITETTFLFRACMTYEEHETNVAFDAMQTSVESNRGLKMSGTSSAERTRNTQPVHEPTERRLPASGRLLGGTRPYILATQRGLA